MDKEKVTATNNIEPLMEKIGTPSLKAIAGVFELNPVRIYSVAKQPKAGVMYDPHMFNWDAIERFITRRLDAEKGIATLEDVIKKALEIDETLKESDGRRSGNRSGGAAWNAKIEVDGVLIAKRRFENFEMSAGVPVVLSKDPEVYAIVLQTASHTVLRPINSRELTDFKGNTVKVISNSMLNIRGVTASSLDDAIESRFSGEYAKILASLAAKAAAKAAKAAEAAKPEA